jgi:ElaB/YqjD/DUF883 family membrane-anchored ribosome-binding protein
MNPFLTYSEEELLDRCAILTSLISAEELFSVKANKARQELAELRAEMTQRIHRMTHTKTLAWCCVCGAINSEKSMRCHACDQEYV